MVQYSGTKLAGAPHPKLARAPCPLPTARPVRAASLPTDWLAQRWEGLACKRMGCGGASARTVFWGRGDPTHVWHKGWLPSCYFLNWYWRAARRPLVFLKLDIPPRPGRRPPVLEGFFQEQLPAPKAEGLLSKLVLCPLEAISACWEAQLASYCPSLLQLQPSPI